MLIYTTIGAGQATAQAMVNRTGQRVAGEHLKAEITKAETAHFDETGIKENGKTRWLHTGAAEAMQAYKTREVEN